MKTCIFIITILILTVSASAQGRITINDNAHITFSNGSSGNATYIVVDNPNANAISTSGSGGHIHSEDEFHKIRWYIRNNTGAYNIPFSTNNNVKIPFQMQITGAGAGGTHIDFATYPTDVMNNPRPTMVTHMLDALTGTVDNSLNVIDRFWILDAMNYSTRPTTTLQFGYDPNELIGNNVSAGGLEAQRFNSTTDQWSGNTSMTGLSWGIDNVTAQRVENAAISNNELYEAWTLSSMISLLPVTLLSFEGMCEEDKIHLQWETGSENNASHYDIQKSIDGQSWTTVHSINASGNTNTTSYYTYDDSHPSNFVNYYRLKQVDRNGDYTLFNIISVEGCSMDDQNRFTVVDYHNGRFDLDFISTSEQTFAMNLYDVSGKKVIPSQQFSVVRGTNNFRFNYPFMSDGMYIIVLENATQKYTKRLMMMDY